MFSFHDRTVVACLASAWLALMAAGCDEANSSTDKTPPKSRAEEIAEKARPPLAERVLQ